MPFKRRNKSNSLSARTEDEPERLARLEAGDSPLSVIVRVFIGKLSLSGAVLAIAFFCASLTPSLMPREALVQGSLSGIAAAVGYFIGVLLSSLWRLFELPELRLHRDKALFWIAAFGVSAMAVALWRSAVWQESARALW